MNRIVFSLAAGVTLGFGAAMFAAPAQQSRPGIVEQPTVIIQNRGAAQAVPISVQGWAADMRPMPVQIAGTGGVQAVQISGTSEVRTRRTSQPWEYRTVAVPSGQDIAGVLASAGSGGWEAIGISTLGTTATVLLKRPL